LSTTIDPVIAGSRGFALTLLAPLTERIGTRPRIAAGAAQARPLCTGPGGLVVVEFVGADTLREIEALVREAKGIRVVAAVPEKLAAAGALLRALGVEVARWDGTATDVVGAVGRQLALASAPLSPSPRVAPKTPPPPTARQAPSAPPAATPVAFARPAVLTPPRPMAAPPEGPYLTPSHRMTAVPAAPASAAARQGLASTAVPWFAQPPKPREPPPAWPRSILGTAEAEEALRVSVASGAAPEGSLAIADVLASLSDVERAVLAGEPQPIDAEPIRRAAVMRVRVASALATAPQPGEEVDAAAVSALIGEIDGLLTQVNELAESAPEDLQASLEAVRNALVHEAIDFSEAAQRASPAAAPAEAAAPHPAAKGRKARKTRLLSVDEAAAGPGRRGLAVWIALGAAVALALGYHGWQRHERSRVRAALTAGLPAGMTQIPGPPGGPRVLVRASSTEAPDPAELARFKAVEEANGNRVREVDGMIFVEPATREAAPPAEPPKP
jgi:hypothetical protein